nr:MULTISPECIES: hypothetical protein [unclassified Haematobacter]
MAYLREKTRALKRFSVTICGKRFKVGFHDESGCQVDAIGDQGFRVFSVDTVALTVRARPADDKADPLKLGNTTTKGSFVDPVTTLNENAIGRKDDHLPRSELCGQERKKSAEDGDVSIPKVEPMSATFDEIKYLPAQVLGATRVPGARVGSTRQVGLVPNMLKHGRDDNAIHVRSSQ